MLPAVVSFIAVLVARADVIEQLPPGDAIHMLQRRAMMKPTVECGGSDCELRSSQPRLEAILLEADSVQEEKTTRGSGGSWLQHPVVFRTRVPDEAFAKASKQTIKEDGAAEEIVTDGGSFNPDAFSYGKINEHAPSSDKRSSNATVTPDLVVKQPAKCVVWHSQHKSAGFLIEKVLEWIPLKNSGLDEDEWKTSHDCKFKCDRQTWNCDTQRCEQEQKNFHYSCDKDYYVAIQGYVATLTGQKAYGMAGKGPCVWATMSLEPGARLRSSLYYCKYAWNNDPLCGKGEGRADPNNATIQEWAKHWGNYLFRELMYHPELKALAQSQTDYKLGEFDCRDQPWVQFKDQLNGGDDPRTQSGKSNLKALRAHLEGKSRKLYDVFGVVEMWNETMDAFDQVMPLEEHSWGDATGGMDDDDHGSSEWKAEENAALEKARKDPVVLAELAADIELYNEVIVPQFQRFG